MRLFVIAIFLLASGSTIFSQVNYVNEEGNILQTGNLDAPFLRASQTTGNKIVGSIYLNVEWEQAIITNLSNKKSSKLLARFNAYHSEIEVLREDITSALLPVDGIQVKLNGKTFVPLKIAGKNKSIFAEILYEGEKSLYKVYNIKINKAPSDAKLLNMESEDKVEITFNYYYSKDGSQVVEIPTSRRSMKSELPSHYMEILKKEKLSPKNEEDLIQLFSILNSK
ncbi:hypothetical protein BFP75_03450 [Maribacter sp. 4G9]|nr:hypothetical protein BFP75_03450 [Maribacter sp. 4G9]